MTNPPTLCAAHADWSVNQAKRRLSWAARIGDLWHIGAPQPVGSPNDLLTRLHQAASGAPLAFGVDFPLGLPRAYANAAAIADFPTWLRGLQPDNPLFQVCDTIADLSLARPFYPRRAVSGPGHRDAQASALGFAATEDLSRAVDHPTARRPGGAPLFWTLGANQCGKAALSAWRDCLLPGFAARLPLHLWPFEGDFHALLRPNSITIAETYPAEALIQLDLSLGGSKRRQSDRAGLAPALLDTIARLRATPSPDLRAVITDGFGSASTGEDAFDSLLGLLNVISVINGAPERDRLSPCDPVEGWVLGQIDPPLIKPPPYSPRRTARQ